MPELRRLQPHGRSLSLFPMIPAGMTSAPPRAPLHLPPACVTSPALPGHGCRPALSCPLAPTCPLKEQLPPAAGHETRCWGGGGLQGCEAPEVAWLRWMKRTQSPGKLVEGQVAAAAAGALKRVGQRPRGQSSAHCPGPAQRPPLPGASVGAVWCGPRLDGGARLEQEHRKRQNQLRSRTSCWALRTPLAPGHALSIARGCEAEEAGTLDGSGVTGRRISSGFCYDWPPPCQILPRQPCVGRN